MGIYKFSQQAEEMISKLANPEEAKKRLIDLAINRNIIITGSDVIKFMIKGEIEESLINIKDVKI